MERVFDYDKAEEPVRPLDIENPDSVIEAISRLPKQETSQTEENANNIARERIVQTSCQRGGGKYVATANKTKKKETTLRKVTRWIAGFGATVLICGALYGFHTAGVKISDKVKYYKDLKTATAIMEENSVEMLLANGLAAYTKDDEFVILRNDILGYASLNLNSPDAIWAMKNIINDDEEFETVIKGCTYRDENGDTCYYTNLEQFLRINGYFDPKTNEPSEEVWENYVESGLVKDYRNGDLTESNGRSK